MRILKILIFILMIQSCMPDNKVNTSKFIFEKNVNPSAIRDSLERFEELSIKIFQSDFIKIRPNLTYYSFYLYVDKTILLNGENLGIWEDIENNKNKIFAISSLQVLSYQEKEELLRLLKYLNDNYIGGVIYYPKEKYATYPYHEKPFHGMHDDRFNKKIILESEFNSLEEEEKKRLLNVNLLTDKKEGMLLFMTQKEKYLAWIYGGYDKIPEKWKQPIYEVFHK